MAPLPLPKQMIHRSQKSEQEASIFHDLTDEERADIKKAAHNSVAFIEQYVPASKRTGDVLDHLDLAFSAWLASASPDKPSAAEVEKMVGAALGEYCIAQLGVRWMKVSDSYGNDFALIGQNPDTRSHPFASVRCRIEDRKTDFVGALFEALRELRKPVAKRNE